VVGAILRARGKRLNNYFVNTPKRNIANILVGMARKMATISEIAWHKETEGKCPNCGRERPLGHVNTCDDFQWPARCIDCCFGPPMEYWEICDTCGELYVGVHCDNPKCCQGSKWCREYS